MAVTIRPPQSAVTSASVTPTQAFRDLIKGRVDQYCSEENHRVLVQHGIVDFGLELTTAQITLDLELERFLVTNEKKLVAELYEALSRFTVSDKKLDKKEESDAIQMVCKAAPGYRYGLNFELAQNAVNDFCRAHGVKKKTGLFSWAVP